VDLDVAREQLCALDLDAVVEHGTRGVARRCEHAPDIQDVVA
jgi:hypothetical protein